MPARARDLIRALRKLGVAVDESVGGSSHFKASKPGFRSYPLSLHNGLKSTVSEVYIRGVCDAFDLDEDELRELL